MVDMALALGAGRVEIAPFGTLPRTVARALAAEARDVERFLAGVGIDVAGIEFIRAEDGRVLVYDVNTNTNYNAEAEQRAGRADMGRSGPGALADYLGDALADLRVAA